MFVVKTLIRRPLLVPTLVLMACAGAGVAGSPAPQSTWDADAVEALVSPYGHSSLSPGPNLRATALMDRAKRKLRVRWKYSQAADFGATPDAYLEQAFAVRYIPTAVEFVNPDAVLVAGVLGNTVVVERWSLEAPSVLTDANGKPALIGHEVESIDLVYSATIGPEAPGIARTLFWNRGKARAAIVRLSGTDDLYELTWPESGAGTGSLVVLMEASVHPELAAAEYDLFIAGNHSTAGYVYGLHVRDKLHLHPSFILFDDDRDGAIDTASAMGYDEQASAGLKDVSQWLEYAGQDPPL